MTTLIFRLAGQTIATSAWTVVPNAEKEIKVTFLNKDIDFGSALTTVYFKLSIEEFLEKVYSSGVIDLRGPRQ
jgi:hypothetical protein